MIERPRRAFASALILVLAGVLGACQHLGPKFQPTAVPPGKAVVYVYRPISDAQTGYALIDDAGQPIGSLGSYQVRANDEVLGRLLSGSYVAHVAEPGELVLAGRLERVTNLTLRVEAGRTYYVRAGTALGVVFPRVVLEEVPEADAGPQIALCRLVEEGPAPVHGNGG